MAASLVAAPLVSLSCRGAEPPAPPAVATVELRGPDSMLVGERARLTLVLRDSLGAVLDAPPEPRWYLAAWDSAVRLTPDGDGAHVEGARSGVALVTVLSHATVGRRRIDVRPVLARVGSVTVEGPATLAVGEEAPYGVVVRDRAGNRLAWGDNPGGFVTGVEWGLAPLGVVSSVLTANQAGVVRGLRPGVATLSATVNGVTGTLVIRVAGAP